jgi:RecB family exonuclease
MTDGSKAVSPRLAAFVCDAVRYAASGSDDDARRLLRAPFSGVPRADAGALLTIARPRRNLLETIEQERVPSAREAQLASRRFLRALEQLRAAFRAQGALARELVVTVAALFDLRDPGARATLDSLERAAGELDALCGERPGTWGVRALCDTLESTVAESTGEPFAPAPLRALGPHEREPLYPVRTRRGHFSASSLGTYAQCERQWYYKYVCSAVEDKSSAASVYGSAFHWALERFHQEYPRADSASRETLARSLQTWIATAFERFRSGFPTNVEYELQRRRARRTASLYLNWFFERARKAPFGVVGTEASVETELDGYTFVGYIDRLDRDDATGAITVVDYKTGNIVENAGAFRSKVANFLDFQLPFYYWARTAEGDRVTRLALIPLKDSILEVRPVELEIVPVAVPRSGYDPATTGTIGIDELERARARMVEIARTLSDEPLERFAPAQDPEACLYCAYVNACRERPLQREDRFGR